MPGGAQRCAVRHLPARAEQSPGLALGHTLPAEEFELEFRGSTPRRSPGAAARPHALRPLRPRDRRTERATDRCRLVDAHTETLADTMLVIGGGNACWLLNL